MKIYFIDILYAPKQTVHSTVSEYNILKIWIDQVDWEYHLDLFYFYWFVLFYSQLLREDIKITNKVVYVSFFSFNSVSFCFVYFETQLLLCTHTCINIFVFCQYWTWYLSFSVNTPCLQVYSASYYYSHEVFLKLKSAWYSFTILLLQTICIFFIRSIWRSEK